MVYSTTVHQPPFYLIQHKNLCKKWEKVGKSGRLSVSHMWSITTADTHPLAWTFFTTTSKKRKADSAPDLNAHKRCRMTKDNFPRHGSHQVLLPCDTPSPTRLDPSSPTCWGHPREELCLASGPLCFVWKDTICPFVSTGL